MPSLARRLRATMALGALVVVTCWWPLQIGSPAWGTFTDTTVPAGANVSTGILMPPTGNAAVRGTCTILSSSAVNLSWTRSVSTFADGYVVLRSTTSGSGYTQIASVPGANTTTFVDTPLPFLTTYHYVVQTTRNLWRSGNSNQASVTTPTPLCI
jgi:hypothetical protein